MEYLIELASTALIRRSEAAADVAELPDDELGERSSELGPFLPAQANAPAATAMRRYALVSAGEPHP